MQTTGDRLSTGERVAFYRRRRGLTQAVLAALVGRSEDWLGKVERGDRPIRRLDVLIELAAALRVELADLLGRPVGDETTRHDILRDGGVPAVRDALMSPNRLSGVIFGHGDCLDPARVTPLADHAWGDYQAGRLGRVIAVLPGLIEMTQTGERRSMLPVSARIHHLAATTLTKVGEADLAWLAGERAITAADHSEDPFVVASAARGATHALLAIGRNQDALRLGESAASWLRARRGAADPLALSLFGMLCLRAAAGAARQSDRTTATDLLDRASWAAERLGRDANVWHTGFGPTNVALHRVALDLDLGDIALAADRGRALTLDGLPVERRVSHRIAVARALSLCARDDESLESLLAAETEAPQLVRCSAVARTTVRTLHRRSSRSGRSGRSGPLTGLAERCRAL